MQQYPIANRDKKYRTALRSMSDISSWQFPCAVTLTMRQAIVVNERRLRPSNIDASANLRHFLNRLNRRLFGRGSQRKGMKVKCIAVEERGGVRPHYHLCLDNPPDKTFEEFEVAIKRCWKETLFGFKEVEVTPCNDGWIRYITKLEPSQFTSIRWIG